jgi:hypothetical protein
MAVFWDVAPCSLVEIYRRFRGSCCDDRPDDGGSKHLWSVGKLLPDYTTQQHRRQTLHTRRRENLKSQSLYVFISMWMCELRERTTYVAPKRCIEMHVY